MNDLTYLVAPALTFLVAAAAPGPATLATAASAMANGRRAGMLIGLGLGIGLAIWGVVAAAGFGAAILAWAPALLGLRLAGGAFLLWLAWKAARSAWRPEQATQPTLPLHGFFWHGLFLNLLNPKAILAWGAVFAIGLPAGAGTTELLTITVVCVALGFAIYMFYAAIFSTPRAMAIYARTRRWIDGACAVWFGLAGLRLLTWRVTP